MSYDWSDTTQAAIQHFLDFRRTRICRCIWAKQEKIGRLDWRFRRLLERNHMGWHFWPYKKMLKTSCMVSIKEPKNWILLWNIPKRIEAALPKFAKQTDKIKCEMH
jgi:hypothetical protein